MQIIDGITVFGEPQMNAVAQMKRIAASADKVALMADHHLGYSMPVGGVAAYREHVSPSGVGYDISCGNKAVKLDIKIDDVLPRIDQVMDEIWNSVSFGVGRKNQEMVDGPVFDRDEWHVPIAASLKDLARAQLGTVGSGNHYVDLFAGTDGYVWCGVHFGSRGFGHKIATYFLKEAGGKDGIDAPPTLISDRTQLGRDYIACMNLAGEYAYAGRDWVCGKVANILGATPTFGVHNHHNFAWRETHGGEDYWVIRKGATPAFPGQMGFIGSSMGEDSVIIRGVESPEAAFTLCSTVHGAGRVMSRTQAAGKFKWVKVDGEDRKKYVQIAPGQVSRDSMEEWLQRAGVTLRGAGTDESPHCYKRLTDVLAAHKDSIEIVETLKPIGVAMAAAHEFDPYRD